MPWWLWSTDCDSLSALKHSEWAPRLADAGVGIVLNVMVNLEWELCGVERTWQRGEGWVKIQGHDTTQCLWEWGNCDWGWETMHKRKMLGLWRGWVIQVFVSHKDIELHFIYEDHYKALSCSLMIKFWFLIGVSQLLFFAYRTCLFCFPRDNFSRRST